MRKYFLVLLLTPLLGIGQTKTVLTSNRLFAKNDKGSEFEKALANHAQKYHTGDVKWRVWSIESGPDAGGYMVTEGPSDWTSLDSRGDISAEHTADWEKNVCQKGHQNELFDRGAPLNQRQIAAGILEQHRFVNHGQLEMRCRIVDRNARIFG